MAGEIEALVMICMLVFIGLVAAVFIFFGENMDFLPRKYWKVRVKQRKSVDSNPPTLHTIKETKGWRLVKKGIPYLRVAFGFPTRGVNLDGGLIDMIDSKGEISIVQKVPDLLEQDNFELEHTPITRQDQCSTDITDYIKACVENNQPIVQEKLREIIYKNSVFDDLKRSSWLEADLNKTNKEKERAKDNNILLAIGLPIAALIIAALFIYLMIDSTNKANVQAMQTVSSPVITYCTEAIKACGGDLPNMTAPTTPTGPLPFKIGG